MATRVLGLWARRARLDASVCEIDPRTRPRTLDLRIEAGIKAGFKAL